MTIYIASDHGGFELKNKIVDYLRVGGFDVKDLGATSYNPEDDYPEYATALARNVIRNPNGRGILLCRNGVGMSLAVNKFKGIRSAISWTPEHAKASRIHDDTNVLVLPADYVTKETAIPIVTNWLNTNFENVERRVRRLKKVAEFGQEI